MAEILPDVSPEVRALMQNQRDELTRMQTSNAETYDRYILALSSSLMGFSAVLVVHVAALINPITIWWIVSSWALFGVAIISTLASIMYGQRVLRIMIDGLEAYYLEGDEKSRDRSAALSERVGWFNLLSGTVFFLGVVCLIIFSGYTVTHMSSKSPDLSKPASSEFGRAAPPNAYQRPSAPPANPQQGATPSTPSAPPAQPSEGKK